ncbi:hypothetical protein EDD15DRAFT_2199537 [Pisolithus albus]|nr:hypothetical protein EDD15DRAFT_2199537 [Pisolithus albus]
MVIPWSNWNPIELIGILRARVGSTYRGVSITTFHTVYAGQSDAHSSYDSAHEPDIQKRVSPARPDVTYVMLVKMGSWHARHGCHRMDLNLRGDAQLLTTMPARNVASACRKGDTRVALVPVRHAVMIERRNGALSTVQQSDIPLTVLLQFTYVRWTSKESSKIWSGFSVVDDTIANFWKDTRRCCNRKKSQVKKGHVDVQELITVVVAFKRLTCVLVALHKRFGASISDGRGHRIMIQSLAAFQDNGTTAYKSSLLPSTRRSASTHVWSQLLVNALRNKATLSQLLAVSLSAVTNTASLVLHIHIAIRSHLYEFRRFTEYYAKKRPFFLHCRTGIPARTATYHHYRAPYSRMFRRTLPATIQGRTKKMRADEWNGYTRSRFTLRLGRFREETRPTGLARTLAEAIGLPDTEPVIRENFLPSPNTDAVTRCNFPGVVSTWRHTPTNSLACVLAFFLTICTIARYGHSVVIATEDESEWKPLGQFERVKREKCKHAEGSCPSSLHVISASAQRGHHSFTVNT